MDENTKNLWRKYFVAALEGIAVRAGDHPDPDQGEHTLDECVSLAARLADAAVKHDQQRPVK